MEYFRFSLFNNLTLLVMGLTAAFAAARWRGMTRWGWAAAYYAVLAGYTFGFDGSYRKEWVAVGVVSAIAIRGGLAWARWIELVVFGYLLWRGVGLLLLW